MKTIGIVYATKTKHSQKLAEAIGRALGVKAENVMDHPALCPTDLLFLVGGIYGGKSLPAFLAYAEKLSGDQVKKAVLVTTSASITIKQDDMRAILKEKGIEVLEEIKCPGSFLFVKAGHPNAADMEKVINSARLLSKQIEEDPA